MGRTFASFSAEIAGQGDERPTRRVEISRPFLMMKAEFRRSEWLALIDSFGEEQVPDCLRARLDIEGLPCPGAPEGCVQGAMSWTDAACIANILSERAGRTPCYEFRACPEDTLNCTAPVPPAQLVGSRCNGYRLPTEAGWEYAARAGTFTQWWGGEDRRETFDQNDIVFDAGFGNWRDRVFARGVASDAPNPWGLHRMIGSMWEWVEDRYTGNWYALRDLDLQARPFVERFDIDPTGPSDDTIAQHGLRGGSAASTTDTADLRSATRRPGLVGIPLDNRLHYANRDILNSFRLVLTLPEAPPSEPMYTRCEGDAGLPCNGCPTGVMVPEGWVCIPPGEFTMGTPEAAEGVEDEREDERPARRVRISRPFLMQQTEVTWGLWTRHMGTRPTSVVHPQVQCSTLQSSHPDCRLGDAGHRELAQLANTMSVTEGLEPCYRLGNSDQPREFADPACEGYRLPTEAEWEYAARANVAEGLWPCDAVEDPTIADYAWMADSTPPGESPLATRIPPCGQNPWGLRGMLGGVWETVDEHHRVDTYSTYASEMGDGPDVDPVQTNFAPLGGPEVARSCGFLSEAEDCRISSRAGPDDEPRNSRRGGRLVRTVSLEQ